MWSLQNCPACPQVLVSAPIVLYFVVLCRVALLTHVAAVSPKTKGLPSTHTYLLVPSMSPRVCWVATDGRRE